MKFLTYSVNTILSLVIFSVILPNIITAHAYEVRPNILIPADWKDEFDDQQIDQYKQNIITGLKDVQQFYARKLNGKTFQINESSFRVAISPNKAESAIEGAANTEKMWDNLEGWLVLPYNPGVIETTWIVGSSNLTRYGRIWYADNPYGHALLSHEDLVNLGRPGSARNTALGMIAHELGHAFGLSFTGWANAHPCSKVSLNECLPGTPEPIPPPDQYLKAIMGSGLWLYPNAGFNNTIYNPEIKKIFQSPFINPGNDPAPEPENAATALAEAKIRIDNVVPNQVKIGDVLEIKGKGFSELQNSSLSFIHEDSPSIELPTEKLVNWDDTSIKLRVPDGVISGSIIVIYNENGEVTSNPIKIVETQSPSFTLTVDFSITCSGDNRSLSGATVNLRKQQGSTLLTKTVSNENGKGQIIWTIFNIQEGNLIIDGDPIQEIATYPSQVIEIPQDGVSPYLNTSVTLHYDQCPNIVGASPSPISSPTPIVSPQQEHEIPLQQTSVPPQAASVPDTSSNTGSSCRYLNTSIDLFNIYVNQAGIDSYIDRYSPIFISAGKGDLDEFRRRVNYIIDNAVGVGLNPNIFLGYWRSESGFSTRNDPQLNRPRDMGCPGVAENFYEQVDCALGINQFSNPRLNPVPHCARSLEADTVGCQTLAEIRRNNGNDRVRPIRYPIRTFDDFAEGYGPLGADPTNCSSTYNTLIEVANELANPTVAAQPPASSENPGFEFLGNIYNNIDNGLGGILPDIPGSQPQQPDQSQEQPTSEPEATPTDESTPQPKRVVSIEVNGQDITSNPNYKASVPGTTIVIVTYNTGERDFLTLHLEKPQSGESGRTGETPTETQTPQPEEQTTGLESTPQPETPQSCDPNVNDQWEYRGCSDQCPGEKWYCKLDGITYPFDNPNGECACQ